MTRRRLALGACAVVLGGLLTGWLLTRDVGTVEGRDVPRTRLDGGHVRAAAPALARIEIPAIGVNAAVVKLGLNRDRTLQVPARASRAGWWSGGARPGEPGTAVIAGHVESREGPAVFYRLRELEAGDRVLVRLPGRPVASYSVERSERAPKDDFPTRRVYTATAGPSLRLITCTGGFDRSTGHYRDNLIVYARATRS